MENIYFFSILTNLLPNYIYYSKKKNLTEMGNKSDYDLGIGKKRREHSHLRKIRD